MLNHQKLVLRNVAYNKELFRKELIKSLDWLSHDEVTILYKWLIENYEKTHIDVIKNVFQSDKVTI